VTESHNTAEQPPATPFDWEARWRTLRTFSAKFVDQLPTLPSRLTIDQFKDFGLVDLRYAKPSTKTPWLRRGFYMLINRNKVFIVEVACNVVKGHPCPVWVFRPIIASDAPAVS
jgi:hypothetical protein